MIVAIIYFMVACVVLTISFLFLLPLMGAITQMIKTSSGDVLQKMASETDNEMVKNVTQEFLNSLDFQTTMIMWIAQYGWIFVAIAVFMGTFMVVRVWKEWERGGVV